MADRLIDDKNAENESGNRAENITEQGQVLLYMHAGSGNHGCEAIADSTCRMLLKKFIAETVNEINRTGNGKEYATGYRMPMIVSNSVVEDRKYQLGLLEQQGMCSLVQERNVSDSLPVHAAYYAYRRISGDAESFQRYRFAPALKLLEKQKENFCDTSPIAVSIGGDNYCYPEMVKDLSLANSMFIRKGFRTVLMGCSIEPASLMGGAESPIVMDLNSYSRIIARESITYDALISANGIDENKVSLCPDPAFLLPSMECELPNGFIKGNTVGINLSPMAQGKESKPGIASQNYKELIKYIISDTDMQIALIPHVVWQSNDDRKPLKALYEEFRETGRVILVSDRSAEQLKYCIASCRFFIGARTHSTIAAYSSCVPTLVLGYSVKSRGIARDLFGTEDGYVVPVQKLSGSTDMTNAFRKILNAEDCIRDRLNKIMKAYCERAVGNICW